MPISIKVTGVVETQQNLNKIAGDLHGRPMEEAMRRAALLIERDAKKNAPVDTGRLRSSISSEIRTEGIGGEKVIGVVGSNVVYAAAVELGSRPHFPPPGVLDAWVSRHGGGDAFLVARAIARRGTKPSKFLQRAFESNQVKIVRLLDTAVSEIVRS